MRRWIVLALILGLSVVSYMAFRNMATLDPPVISPHSPRQLIINADDLLLNPGTNEGILRGFREGVITSTTAMMNMPQAAETLQEIHALAPDLPIGVHINITTGRPVLTPEEVPSLVDENGFFFNADTIPLKLLEISLEEVRAEVMAQVDLFLETGVPLSHLDYHHNIMALYSPFYEIVREIAKEHNLPVRNPVPASVYGVIEIKGGGGSAASMQKMISLGIRRPVTGFRLMRMINPKAFQANLQALEAEGIPTPHWFVDSFYENATLENFLSILDQLPPGVSEIMVHPSSTENPEYADACLELEILTDPRVQERTKELSIDLINFRSLAP